jgi:hypothetical protein
MHWNEHPYHQAPCEHIYAYYERQWLANKCLGFRLLMKAYYQAARGIWHYENNLFVKF